MNRIYVRAAAGAAGILLFGTVVVVELHPGRLINSSSSSQSRAAPVPQHIQPPFPITLSDEQLASQTAVYVGYATGSEHGVFSGPIPPDFYAEIRSKLRAFYKWLVDALSDVYRGVRPSVPGLIASQVIGYLFSKFRILFARGRNGRTSLPQPMSQTQDGSADEEEATDLATQLVQGATRPDNEITVPAPDPPNNENNNADPSDPGAPYSLSSLTSSLTHFGAVANSVLEAYKLMSTQQDEMKQIALSIQSSVDINKANAEANRATVAEFEPLMEKMKDYPKLLDTVIGWQEKALKRIEELERKVKVLMGITEGVVQEQKGMRKELERERGGRSGERQQQQQEGRDTGSSLNATANVGGELQDLAGLDNANWLQAQIELLQKERGELAETVRRLVVKIELLQEEVAADRESDDTGEDDVDLSSDPGLFGLGPSSPDVDDEQDNSSASKGIIGRGTQIHDRASREDEIKVWTSLAEKNEIETSDEQARKGKEERKPFKDWFKSNILSNRPPPSAPADRGPNQDEDRKAKTDPSSSASEQTFKLDFTPKLKLDSTPKPKLKLVSRRGWLQQQQGNGKGLPEKSSSSSSSVDTSTTGPSTNPPRELFGSLSLTPASNSPSPSLFAAANQSSSSPTPSHPRPGPGASQSETGYLHPSLPTYTSTSSPGAAFPTTDAARPASSNPNQAQAFRKYLSLPSSFSLGRSSSEAVANPQPDSSNNTVPPTSGFGFGFGNGKGFETGRKAEGKEEGLKTTHSNSKGKSKSKSNNYKPATVTSDDFG